MDAQFGHAKRPHRRALSAASVLLTCLLLAACEQNAPVRNELTAGETQLDSVPPHYDRAIIAANQVLASGDDSFTAEALFLRARAVEDRPKSDLAARQRDAADARKDYNAALTHNPSPSLEYRLHMQIANCAYFQDDSAAALREWTVAYNQIDRPDWKSFALYRMGLCQQRLGRYTDADRTFALLEEQFPDSIAAKRALTHKGNHNFYVELGAFKQQPDIDAAAAAIVAAGSVPMKTTGGNGGIVIRTADVKSYAQAVTLRNSLWPQYPNAQILP